MTNVATRTFEGITLPAPGTFTVDPSHTRVGFVARHLMVTKVRGQFADVAGSITIDEDPLRSSASATMQAASLDSGSEDRDTHVRSADFLDVEHYPEVRFQSRSISGPVDGVFEVTGELTVKDVTREITLEVELEGVATDPWGGERIAVSARGTIDREDFGLTWNVALEGGGVLVSKKVQIEIDAQLVRQG